MSRLLGVESLPLTRAESLALVDKRVSENLVERAELFRAAAVLNRAEKLPDDRAERETLLQEQRDSAVARRKAERAAQELRLSELDAEIDRELRDLEAQAEAHESALSAALAAEAYPALVRALTEWRDEPQRELAGGVALVLASANERSVVTLGHDISIHLLIAAFAAVLVEDAPALERGLLDPELWPRNAFNSAGTLLNISTARADASAVHQVLLTLENSLLTTQHSGAASDEQRRAFEALHSHAQSQRGFAAAKAVHSARAARDHEAWMQSYVPPRAHGAARGG
jgi:hypothetical protein